MRSILFSLILLVSFNTVAKEACYIELTADAAVTELTWKFLKDETEFYNFKEEDSSCEKVFIKHLADEDLDTEIEEKLVPFIYVYPQRENGDLSAQAFQKVEELAAKRGLKIEVNERSEVKVRKH